MANVWINRYAFKNHLQHLLFEKLPIHSLLYNLMIASASNLLAISWLTCLPVSLLAS